MRAGKLDRCITIQRATTTENDFGEIVEDWDNLALEVTVWAQQRPNRGAERFRAQEIAGKAVMTFHMRYRADLKVTDRISYDGKLWNILDIREIGRRVVTEIDVAARSDS